MKPRLVLFVCSVLSLLPSIMGQDFEVTSGPGAELNIESAVPLSIIYDRLPTMEESTPATYRPAMISVVLPSNVERLVLEYSETGNSTNVVIFQNPSAAASQTSPMSASFLCSALAVTTSSWRQASIWSSICALIAGASVVRSQRLDSAEIRISIADDFQFSQISVLVTAQGNPVPSCPTNCDFANCGTAVCSCSCQVADPNTFYVDSINGDDSFSGQLPTRAWRTLERASNATRDGELMGAMTLRLRRGQVHRGELALESSGVSSASPLTISDWGSSALPAEINGFEEVSGWTPGFGSVFFANLSISIAGVVLQDGSPLVFLPWMTDATTSFSGASAGSYSFDFNTQTLYVWTTDSANPNSHLIEIASETFCVSGNNLNFLHIERIRTVGAAVHCFGFGDTSNTVVTNVDIQFCGGAFFTGPSFYLGNGLEFGDDADNVTFSNSVVDNIFDSCATVQTFNPTMRTPSNIIFSGLTLSRCGFAALELTELAGGGNVISGIEVRDCTITQTGRGFSGRRNGVLGHAIIVAANFMGGSISDTTIINTVADDCAGEGVAVTGNVDLVNITQSRFTNMERGINYAVNRPNTELIVTQTLSARHQGAALSFNGLQTNLTLLSNTFADGDLMGLEGVTSTLIQNVLGYNIQNNAWSSADQTIFAFASLNTFPPGGILDFNAYANPSATQRNGYNLTIFTSQSQFFMATGFEESGVFIPDPMFVAPALSNYAPAAGSPLIGAGNPSISANIGFQ